MRSAEIDCRGMACPRPIIELARCFDELEAGAEIRLMADDPAAGPDVEAWCRMRGAAAEYAGAETAPDGVPVYVVRKTG